MEGQEVFKFAVKKVPECIEELLAQTRTTKEEIKYYLLHQANSRIISSAAKRLKEPEEKFPINMEHYGNTSAASIPILLDELNRQGKLQRGDKLILSRVWRRTYLGSCTDRMVGGKILINGKRTATQKYEYRKNLADISAWQFFSL